MKLAKQIAALAAMVFLFAAFNISIYTLCTKRCIPDSGEVKKAKVIKLEKYLPFDDNSLIVKLDGSLELTGELPVIDGAEGLYPVFSAVVNALYPESSVSFDGKTFGADSRLQMNNTLRAYKAVVDGTSDIVFCASPSAAQLAYAEEKGVKLEFVPIGREAFVFLVNVSNPVDNLTVEQVRGIFAGEYRSWAQLGGENVPISPLQRLEGSGSQSALVGFMKGREMARDYDSFLGSAIGFSFRYYVSEVIENGGVKMLSLNGAYPNRENIINGSYPVVSPFYAVYDKANDNPNVRLIIDWLLSSEGQYIIGETGYIPLA